MSVLSDSDIIRELGKGIFFYPLKQGSIKACDICLTASEYAYAIGIQQRLVVKSEPSKEAAKVEQKFFEVPSHETALVWTDESVYLSNRFRGPLYSIVGLVSKGIGHIGTRVNPCWSGALCIALHNVSDKPLRINIRDVNQPVAYLAVEKLSSKSFSGGNIDRAARLDILRGLSGTSEIHDFFNQRENSWMMGDTDALKKRMLNSVEYKKVKRRTRDFLQGLFSPDALPIWTAIAGIAAVLSAIFTGVQAFNSSNSSSGNLTNPSTQNTPVKLNKYRSQ
jgi:deoxycytidine triphosphate deaminase